MILRLMFVVLVFLWGCQDYRSEIDKVSDHLLHQLAKQVRKKDLIAIGSGGGCTIDKKVNLISMTFQYQKLMSMDEARELLVESVQKLLDLINNNPENSKYFEHFPAPVDIVQISILGGVCPQDLNCIEVVKIINGTVQFNVNNPMVRFGPYLTLKEESFEEAQKIVAAEQASKEVLIDYNRLSS